VIPIENKVMLLRYNLDFDWGKRIKWTFWTNRTMWITLRKLAGWVE
jgi:hypothetical protein